MNKNEWDKTATEQNAKAEQIGSAIAILWFVALFICLPLAIMFPPSIFLMLAAGFWVVSRMRKSKR